jgi:hypothetical protein
MHWTRAATFVVVLAVHVLFFFVFAVLRVSLRLPGAEATPTIAVFLPEPEPAEPPRVETTSARAERAPRHATARPPREVARSEPEPPSTAITPIPAPDWRAEAQRAADEELEAEARRRQQPSALEPHDFSRVKPGSTDDHKPKFGWYHAGTHRIEAIPNGGFVVNINDRCGVVILIYPVPFCKIGKIPVRGDLLDHMHDAPMLGESELP